MGHESDGPGHGERWKVKMIFISAEQWAKVSEEVHSTVFGKTRPASDDRITFALATQHDDGTPIAYITGQERGSGTLYIQYGGAFPDSKATTLIWKSFQEALYYCKIHYKRVALLVENTNSSMIRLALKAGFKIIGTRTFEGAIYLDHLLEF